MQWFSLFLAWLFWISCHHRVQKLWKKNWLFITLDIALNAQKYLPSCSTKLCPKRHIVNKQIKLKKCVKSSLYTSQSCPSPSKLDTPGTIVDCCWFCWKRWASDLLSPVYTYRIEITINRNRPTEANTLCRFSMEITGGNKKKRRHCALRHHRHRLNI